MTFGAVLDQTKALSVRPCVDIRVRCILKDVLELRQNGWNVQSPEQLGRRPIPVKGRLNGTEERVLSLHSEPVRDNLNLGVAHCRCGPQPESWVRGEVSACTSTNTLLLVCICLQICTLLHEHLPSSHRHVAHMSTAPTHTHPRWLKILERHHKDTHPFETRTYTSHMEAERGEIPP